VLSLLHSPLHKSPDATRSTRQKWKSSLLLHQTIQLHHTQSTNSQATPAHSAPPPATTHAIQSQAKPTIFRNPIIPRHRAAAQRISTSNMTHSRPAQQSQHIPIQPSHPNAMTVPGSHNRSSQASISAAKEKHADADDFAVCRGHHPGLDQSDIASTSRDWSGLDIRLTHGMACCN
jgi:hypothetical protein